MTCFLSGLGLAALAVVLVVLYFILEKQEVRRRLIEALAALRDANQQADSRVRALAEQHQRALFAERRKRLIRDQYGTWHVDDWLREVRYFVKNVVWEDAKMEPLVHDIIKCQGGVSLSDRLRFPELVPNGELAMTTEQMTDRWSTVVAERVEEIAQTQSPARDDVIDPKPEVLTGADFELLCADLLRAGGWDVRSVGKTGDQGVDLVATRDSHTVVLQCKLYNKPVGNKAIQEIHAGREFWDADYAAVISAYGYTKSARAAAQTTGVLLLDIDDLEDFDPC